MEEINKQAEKGNLAFPGALYLQMIDLLRSGFNTEAYKEAKELFFQGVPNLAYKDRRVLFQSLINIAVRVANEKGASHLRETWDLYNQGLEYQVIFNEKGELGDTTFTNIIVNGAFIQEFDQAAQFILDYESRLAPNIRDNAVALGKAFCDTIRVNLRK
ncbi:MAG: hypothetical protein IPJ40_14830 [Saprospirales bacterium]|nr:hypothetical protein [Saprospirales bacterium]